MKTEVQRREEAERLLTEPIGEIAEDGTVIAQVPRGTGGGAVEGQAAPAPGAEEWTAERITDGITTGDFEELAARVDRVSEAEAAERERDRTADAEADMDRGSDGRSMAGYKRRRTYPWDQWQDGGVWRVTASVEPEEGKITSPAHRIQTAIHTRGSRVGLEVRTRIDWDVVGQAAIIWFQMVAPGKDFHEMFAPKQASWVTAERLGPEEL